MARRPDLTAALVVGAIALVAVAIGVGLRGGRATPPASPNVLLLTLDTTRADHLHCYGYAKDTSPNLDALAADAVRFDMAISTSAITPISHASILTGLNPHQHGVRVFYGMTGYKLTQAHPTLATILQSQGWTTGAFVSAYPASERFGLNWGFDTFQSEVAPSVMVQDPALRRSPDGYFLRQRKASAQRRGDETADQALAWLQKARRPFLLWAHFFDPHDPALVPPEEITARFGAYPNSPEPFKQVYDPEICFMDQQIGRLLAYLKQAGQYDNTIIVAVADHGQGLGDHAWFPHRLLYQEQIRLPMIVRLPKGPRGVVVPATVRSVDILPTILEALGFDPPPDLAGLSLCGLLHGESEPPRTALAEALNTLDAHTPPELAGKHKDLLFCQFDFPWKLIYHKNEPENTELYDLRSDPRELNNVAAEFPAERDRLIAALEESGAMHIEIVAPTEPMDPEGVRKLRSLGYIGDQ